MQQTSVTLCRPIILLQYNVIIPIEYHWCSKYIYLCFTLLLQTIDLHQSCIYADSDVYNPFLLKPMPGEHKERLPRFIKCNVDKCYEVLRERRMSLLNCKFCITYLCSVCVLTHASMKKK